MPQLGNAFVYLVARELAAFARLRSLRHLDLQFVRVDQVVRGYAKPRRGHLLHRTTPQVSVGVGLESCFVFSAFAGVGLSADAVHGDG